MGAIFVCANRAAGLARILSTIGNAPHRIFEAEKEDFSVDEARALIAEAFVASETEKFLIATANGFRTEAQNALLKLLEEPPRNITIYLLATGKAAFLPTVRSRLPLTVIPSPRPPSENLIDFARLDLAGVYEFMKASAYLPKDRAKRVLEEAFEFYSSIAVASPVLRAKFLAAFDRGFKLLSLSTTAANALLPILLLFLENDDHAKTPVRR